MEHFILKALPSRVKHFPSCLFFPHSPFDDAPAHQAVIKTALILERNHRPTAISLFYSETRTHGLMHLEHPAHLWQQGNSSLVVSACLLLLLLQKE